MGLLDFLKPKKESEKTEEKKAEKTAEKPSETDMKEPKTGFREECALCSKGNTEKKWAGQYWHVRCLRAARKGAKGMI